MTGRNMAKTRFLKKNFMTERRAAALEILGASDGLSPEIFARKMWAGMVPPNFGAYFLSGMITLGLVEKRGRAGAEVYGVTHEGKDLLTSAPWRCGYCGASKWKMGVSLMTSACSVCGSEHLVCTNCTKTLVVAAGEFPRYRAALKECPRAVRT